MKYITLASRLLVGCVLIFSSLIKLNDLHGFSYKLEEYFSADVLGLPFLEPYALVFSITIAFIEFTIALFVLLAYKKRLCIWGLFGMLVFFAFLTFYSAYYNKVTDCGCFGDAIHLRPWHSFTKDIVLIILALPLWRYGKTHWKQFFKIRINTILIICFCFAGVALSWHTLNHLPIIDLRAYKEGVNISDAMEIPEDAAEDIYEYAWTFREGNRNVIIKNEGAYPETKGVFVGVKTQLIKTGYRPPIEDFRIDNKNLDVTKALLQEPKLVLIICPIIENASVSGLQKISKQMTAWQLQKYKVILVSASSPETVEKIAYANNIHVECYSADGKMLKTIIRANPGIVKMSYGTIDQKLHHNDISNFKND